MKDWLRKLMLGTTLGRYGQDNLNRMLSVLAMILMLLSMFTGLLILYVIAFSLLLLSFIRMFSKNTARRIQENNEYLKIQRRITGYLSDYKKQFDDRKTHCYYRCPSCRTRLRVPKGLGRIKISCTKCQMKFEKIS